MGYRFIFSQMFDVRPRTSDGELDLEKFKKIEEFLNLRIDEAVLKSQRTINLRPKPHHLEILNDTSPQQAAISPVGEKSGRNIDFLAELYNENIPEESDILSIFDIIEATDELLKRAPEPEIVHDIPIKNIIEETQEEAAAEVELSEMPQPEVEQNEPELDFSEIHKLLFDTPPEPILDLDENDLFMRQLPAALALEEHDFGNEIPSQAPEQNELVSQSPQEILLQTPYGKEPDLSFWNRPQAESQAESVPGSEFLTPEFLLGAQAVKESLAWKSKKKPMLIFLAAAFLIFSFIPLLGWFNRALTAKDVALNFGLAAYQSLMEAKDSLEKANFSQAGDNFKNAYNYFAAADLEIKDSGGWLISILEKIPGFSYLSSRMQLIKVGQDMSKAGQEFTAMIGLLQNGNINFSKSSQAPLSDIIAQGRDRLESGLKFLVSAKQNMEEIKISDLPSEIQPRLTQLFDKMPQITATAAMALDWTDKFLEILGHQSAKKYLLIFQNNAEMRATGGFVGTYGLVDLDQGEVKNLFVDGIFNADGQLMEKVEPPTPIQKISTAWSMHDANWFADFPTSAQKIMWFYEKTGGATPDGVISLTPTVIERLLVLTGPIDMPQYGVSLDVKNFFEITQYKVEADYDKQINQPKKILADFAPKFIERISEEMKKNNIQVLKIINQLLEEKHILVYFSDPQLEEFAKKQGWAGQIKEATQDYFSVVNTNINGFKTDRVIEEKIDYSSEISADGSIIDTLKITRHHQGGNASYDWFNKVNADYLRVYVPGGATLLSASGQTREEIKPPIDYAQAGFKTDADVLAENQSLKKDQASGTDIFEESGKTVFGNWVYVGPGETVTLIYQYQLPFKIDKSGANPSFSLLAQKQSGSPGSEFKMQVSWPVSWQIVGPSDGLALQKNQAILETDLSLDRLFDFKFSNVR